jgi:hypothetical protein
VPTAAAAAETKFAAPWELVEHAAFVEVVAAFAVVAAFLVSQGSGVPTAAV